MALLPLMRNTAPGAGPNREVLLRIHHKLAPKLNNSDWQLQEFAPTGNTLSKHVLVQASEGEMSSVVTTQARG
jgi:hypothetical protein